jgi:hypothetical protein
LNKQNNQFAGTTTHKRKKKQTLDTKKRNYISLVKTVRKGRWEEGHITCRRVGVHQIAEITSKNRSGRENLNLKKVRAHGVTDTARAIYRVQSRD